MMQSQTDRAIEVLERVIKADPTSAQAREAGRVLLGYAQGSITNSCRELGLSVPADEMVKFYVDNFGFTEAKARELAKEAQANMRQVQDFDFTPDEVKFITDLNLDPVKVKQNMTGAEVVAFVDNRTATKDGVPISSAQRAFARKLGVSDEALDKYADR